MLCDVAVVVGGTRTQSMPLVMLTMKKELHGFLFFCMLVVLSLLEWCSARAPLSTVLCYAIAKPISEALAAGCSKPENYDMNFVTLRSDFLFMLLYLL